MAFRLFDPAVWKTSLFSFFLGLTVTFIGLNLVSADLGYYKLVSYVVSLATVSVPLALAVILTLLIGGNYFDTDQKEAIPRSVFLGVIFGAGLSNVAFSNHSDSSSVVFTLGFYFCALSFFHYSEFLSTAWWNSRHLSVDSFLLNHSPEYHAALVVSWLEFVLEFLLGRYFFGVSSSSSFYGVFSKDFDGVAKVGLCLIVAGEFCRKLAMWTAKSNFNHLIQWEKNPDHVLVTSGIYSFSRHPSYVGWFLWSVGTQILLNNPFCFVCYAVVSWKFFDQRIRDEEATLISFFGDQYLDYQERVGTGLLGVKGLQCDEKEKEYVRRKWTKIREKESAK